MLILLNVISSDRHSFSADYDYAVIKLDIDEAKIVSGYLNTFDTMKKAQPDLIEATFNSDVICEWYPCTIWDDEDDMPEELRTGLDNNGYAIIPEGMELPFTPKDAHAPDSTYLQVGEDSFCWRGIPNNCDITVDTLHLPREILAQVL